MFSFSSIVLLNSKQALTKNPATIISSLLQSPYSALLFNRKCSYAKKVEHSCLQDCLEAGGNIAPYTLVQSSHQNEEELQLHYMAAGKRPNIPGGVGISSLIIPKRETSIRAAVASLSELLTVTPPDDIDYGQWVNVHTARLMSKIKPQNLAQQRKIITEKIRRFSTDNDDSALNKKTRVQIKEYKTLMKSRIHNGQLEPYTEAEIHEIAIDLTANQMLAKQEASAVTQAVTAIFQQEINDQKHHSRKLIPYCSLKRRHNAVTLFQAGPPGTGKGQTLSYHMEHPDDNNGKISPDYAVLSPDRKRQAVYHKMSLPKDERHRIGTLSHDESIFLYNRSLDIYYQRVMQGLSIPNTIIEQVYPWPKNRAPFLEAGSAVINLHMRCPWNTVLGVINRGKQSSDPRIVPIKRVLDSYKLISNKAPEMLLESVGEPMQVYFYHTEAFLHAKFERGESIDMKPFAVANCQQNRLYILDIDLFYQMIAYRNIDSNASTKDEILAYQATVTHDDCAQTLLAEYGQMEILFIDPSCDDTSVTSLQGNVVAKIDGSKGIEIYEHQGFCQLREKSATQLDALHQATCQLNNSVTYFPGQMM